MSKIFIIAFLIFASVVVANTQTLPPSYGFLEVVDYKNQPVIDAKVIPLNSNIYDQRQTNQKGQLENGFPRPYSKFAIFNFSIEKDGYYPFYDYFGVFKFLGGGGRNNKDEPIQIELLKIPKSRAEKKAIGNEQQKREFFGAARKGDALAVRKFIKSGLSPNLTTSDLRGVPATKDIPIIIYAAKSGNGETVKAFLSAGVNVRKKAETINNILVVYLEAYPFRLNYYPDTEAENIEFLDAYENGAESLIKAGAKVGSDALMIAVEKGYMRTLKKLISKGVALNAPDYIGRNALLTAIQSERTEIINFLLEKGANPNILYADTDSDNSYFSYCTSPLMSATERKNVSLVKLLLANRADPNLTCKNGKNALRNAIKNGNGEIFDLLITSGADVKAVDNNGETNLMYAVQHEDTAAVKKMIEMGIPVNTRNKQGSTALMIAVSNGSMYSRLHKVKLLLKAGADPNVVNDQKFTNSSGYQFQRCETALINVAADADLDSVQNTPLSIIDLLIANKTDVNFTCQNGQNALLRAIYNGQVKGVKKLLDAGADVSGEKGKAALDYARKVPKSGYNKNQIEEIIKMLEAVVEK